MRRRWAKGCLVACRRCDPVQGHRGQAQREDARAALEDSVGLPGMARWRTLHFLSAVTGTSWVSFCLRNCGALHSSLAPLRGVLSLPSGEDTGGAGHIPGRMGKGWNPGCVACHPCPKLLPVPPAHVSMFAVKKIDFNFCGLKVT